jgi:hypothetical protein
MDSLKSKVGREPVGETPTWTRGTRVLPREYGAEVFGEAAFPRGHQATRGIRLRAEASAGQAGAVPGDGALGERRPTSERRFCQTKPSSKLHNWQQQREL